jgi:spore germination protein KB
MKTDKDKISVRQLFFVFTIIVSSPATRFLSKYLAGNAGQAGWVSPLVCTIPFLALILMLDSLLKKYQEQSMSDIIEILMGKFIGRLICFFFLLMTIYYTAMYMRYYVERLTSSIYPYINNNVLIILTLIPIAYMLRSGFTVIARMSEVLLPFIGVMLVMLSAFVVTKVRTDNVLPVYFNDIVPVVKSSLAPAALLAYLFFLFFLSDKVVNLKSLKTFGYIAAYVNISSMALLSFITIGVLGASLTERAPMPTLVVIKQISLMDTIENIEAVIVAIWIFADFTLITTFFVIALNLIKSIFRLSDTKPLINTLAVFIYFLSLGICSTKFELEEFSNKVLVPLNSIIGFGFPAVLFALSKLRKNNPAQSNEKG